MIIYQECLYGKLLKNITRRNFIGIELVPEYFDIAKERIYKAQHEDKGEKDDRK